MKKLLLKVRSSKSFKLEKSITLKARDSIYFMGVCGTAMASLAVYLKKQGFVIAGSDENIYPPMSLVLQKEAVPILKYSSDNIQNSIKLIVVGNVISSSHIEIQKAKTLNIPVLSLPEFLQQSFLSYSKKYCCCRHTWKKHCNSSYGLYGRENRAKSRVFYCRLPL